ncbi:OmpA family protein [Enterovibrio nigricans]|nr:OmpA family protein [Enterovibrio nigricans]
MAAGIYRLNINIFLSLFFSLLVVQNVQAELKSEIVVPMDDSSWIYQGGLFECTLTHVETPYGKYYFRSLPGGILSFDVSANSDILQSGDSEINGVSVYLISPPWKSTPSSSLISTARGNDLQHYSFVEGIDALVEGVASGSWIQVRFQDSKKTDFSVSIPSIRIAAPISSFTACTAELPGMGYEDARTLALRFAHGQHTLTPAQKRKLSDFHSYVVLDSSISNVLIDGHTDATGSRVANLKTSRARAELVANTLKDLGIDAAKLEVRAHGERYPIATNATPEGRNENRRVTLRLVKQTERVKNTVDKSNITKTINETAKVQ